MVLLYPETEFEQNKDFIFVEHITRNPYLQVEYRSSWVEFHEPSCLHISPQVPPADV